MSDTESASRPTDYYAAPSIEFRQREKNANWIDVLVDDVAVGWINREGTICQVVLWLNHKEIDFAQGYGSLETAKRKIIEHYRTAWPEFIEAT